MNAIVTKDSLAPEIISSLVIGGDLSKLTNEQQVAYYKYRCQQVGLDPSAKPFDLLTLNGKKVLYANAGCTQQLCQIHGLSPTITDRTVVEGIYCVTSRVTGGGRTTENMGAVPVGGLKGDMLANAMMKAITKAHRRTILMHCGLGMLDETEVETIPEARQQMRGNPIRQEYAGLADEIQACGDKDTLNAFWQSPDVQGFLARAEQAASRGGVDYAGALLEQYNRREAEVPERKEDKRAFIKSTDEYKSTGASSADVAEPVTHVPPAQPSPLGDLGEKASAILDRIDVAELDHMAAIAADAKAAKDAGELTAAEADLIQKSYGVKARKMKRAA